MKIFKIVPKYIPRVENSILSNKVVGISGRIVWGDVGAADTKHSYYVEFHREITDGEETRIEIFHGTSLEVTQADTVAIMTQATQYVAVTSLAAQYGFELLHENQQ